MAKFTGILLFLVCLSGFHVCFGNTDPQDVAALRSLMEQWQNTPSAWGQTDDPCGTAWQGITCTGSRVVTLILSNQNIQGTLSGDIGQLSQLQTLDLSLNGGLGGPLTENIGNLKQLTSLSLQNCSFTGSIPGVLGSLSKLSFLALNSNQFSGTIPASLGNLSNVYWLDLSYNQLSGQLPISSGTSPGLDLLVHTQHFHFNQNNLSGTIPEKLFSSQMQLIHILFDGNNFTGEIPASIGLVNSLEALRLDRNGFSGPVPSSIANLTNLHELNLANNKLTGLMPNLTGMSSLNYVDLSNNTFNRSETPLWFSTLDTLTSLVVSYGRLSGPVPQKLFSLPQIQQVILDNNEFTGTLGMGSNISSHLQTVNFENNNISLFTPPPNFHGIIMLHGNEVCETVSVLKNTIYCSDHPQALTPYSTSLASCGSSSCSSGLSVRPLSCNCACPLTGMLTFRAPYFSDVTNSTVFQDLENQLWQNLSLSPGSVYLENPFFDENSYMQVQVKLFPPTGTSFNQSEVSRISSQLGQQNEFKPPKIFGPYLFTANPYPCLDNQSGGSSLSKGAAAGIAAGCAIVLLTLIGMGIYAFRQKRRAERATEISKPFAAWASTKGVDGVPQLKGARWFTFDELTKITNNFAEMNEIGAGGYGKVYKGQLTNGQVVAIKRAQAGSLQGAAEFKTEIELLSRVHHKNLVGLVGFCFEQGEQMLVYEFISNGTLRENLSAENGKQQLDWMKRLKIALGSARGLAYLHELADPPIIHRDIKSANILLDKLLNAKVADFGLSKLVSDAEKGHVSTQVKGTLGYLDPEYYMTQLLTEKSDVYSYGVVMLELITGKPPLHKGKYIVREVRLALNMMGEDPYCGLEDMVDTVIRNSETLIAFKSFVQLAMLCVEETGARRPKMNQVVKEIELMLQSDGFQIEPESEPSSATDFYREAGVGTALHGHLYNDQQLPTKEASSSGFDYSGAYALSTKIEPK
ncbi:probable leucine-rich repeat receptor-like protein kinase At5g49770 [Dioscorea cayenensis subsp. rotundata]|uniref:non-specific serine/threonine protein kinase n=1 Tax=Dioscorea cayennensis subsp. rotundata TaxID=55577 RepID=A0AB40BZW1_DIOCR|nr:probable leucine-rich repeat receptor-like protein kinase At5g49770 [Dioscorea cayenensis subsp. rotundata]